MATGFYQDIIDEMLQFQAKNSYGFDAMRRKIGKMRTHKFDGSYHLSVFDATVTHWDKKLVQNALEEQNLAFSVSVYERILLQCSRFIRQWEYTHPLTKTAVLSEKILTKVEALLNKELEPFGLAVSDLPDHIEVRTTNGGRFPTREPIYMLDEQEP